jgi:acetyl esterase/lipase
MMQNINIENLWFLRKGILKHVPFICLVFLSFASFAQLSDFLQNTNGAVLYNEKYAEAERNVFDIIMPKSANPTALVIYIHGGGFFTGDKKEPYGWRKTDIEYYLRNNVAFASINYRYYKSDDSAGVRRCLEDVRKALQYIRFNAGKYNIDKERIGCYGTSAGAGSSLYLAFHDDMAVKGHSGIEGESTRIRCAGAIATQATYNLLRWMDFIPHLKLMVQLKKKSFYKAIAGFYGYPSFEAFKPLLDNVTHQLDMISMISSDDPPVYVMNMQKERFPKDYNIIQHHRKHALILDEYLDTQKVGHEIYVYSRKQRSEKDIQHKIHEFMVEKLADNK